MERMLPRLLLVPTAVLHLLGAVVLEEYTPWDIYKVQDRLQSNDASQPSREQCSLIRNWAMGAAHLVLGKQDSEFTLKSGLAVTTNRPFHEWAQCQVNSVLGAPTPQTTV
jgi:hypothetical protein